LAIELPKIGEQWDSYSIGIRYMFSMEPFKGGEVTGITITIDCTPILSKRAGLPRIPNANLLPTL
jgi:hypothetical protein